MKTFKDWLTEGDQLYQQALQEYQTLEAQIEDLEKRLAIKKDEVDQIASVIGKQPVQSSRRLTAELVDSHGSGSVPNSPATIARALTGRGLGGGR